MVKKVSEILQGIAAIWLVFVAFTIFAEVTFRNFGLFLGADQIVQNSVPAIVFLQVPFAIVSGTMLRTTLIYEFCSKNAKIIINVLSFLIGIMLFVGIAVIGGILSEISVTSHTGIREVERLMTMPIADQVIDRLLAWVD